MNKGIILKIDSTQSDVMDLITKNIIECKAKGNLKRTKTKLTVGDIVEYELIDNNTGYINSVEKRKNEIYRPKISNVDQVFIVSSLKEPNLGTYIIDKYIMFLEILDIEPILLFTKKDLLTDKDIQIKETVKEYSQIGYKTIEIDNENPDKNTLNKIEKLLENKLSIFIGQTGAGKTTTLNNFLSSDDKLKTQEISKSLNRGKHTTTNVTVYNLGNNILIADSPGFSSFELKDIDEEHMVWAYRIFKKYIGQCKFNNCMHLKEIGCEIKKQVEEKNIPEFLYTDYVKIIEEFREGKR